MRDYLSRLRPQIDRDASVRFRTGINPITAMISLKTTHKCAKFESVSLFVFLFALAWEMIFIKAYYIESTCVKGPENILFQARPCVFQLGYFTGWGSEGVNNFFATNTDLTLSCLCDLYAERRRIFFF